MDEWPGYTVVDAAQQEVEHAWTSPQLAQHNRTGAPPPRLMQHAPANGHSGKDGAGQCGIGLTMDIHHRTKVFFVASVKPGGAAERAGLAPGEFVTAVNGTRITGVDMRTVRAMIVGPEGSIVRMTVEGGGGALKEVSCVRTPGTLGGTPRGPEQPVTLRAALLQQQQEGSEPKKDPTDRIMSWLSDSVKSVSDPPDVPQGGGQAPSPPKNTHGGESGPAQAGEVTGQHPSSPDTPHSGGGGGGLGEPLGGRTLSTREAKEAYIDRRVREAVERAMGDLLNEENSRLTLAHHGLSDLSVSVAETLKGFKEHLEAMAQDRAWREETQEQISKLSEQVDSLLDMQLARTDGTTATHSDIL